MNSLDAKNLVDRFGLTHAESLFLRMVALHESGYGTGWKSAGVGSNNWGAITAGPSWTGETFQYGDSRYDEATKTVIPYTTLFRKYPSAEAGARDMIGVLLKPNVRSALDAGDLRGAVSAMRANKYFLGTTTYETSIDRYLAALKSKLATILGKTGEPNPFLAGPAEPASSLPFSQPPGFLPTVGVGDRGTVVALAQRLLIVKRDGIFGPITETACKMFQATHNLPVTGKIDQATWLALIHH